MVRPKVGYLKQASNQWVKLPLFSFAVERCDLETSLSQGKPGLVFVAYETKQAWKSSLPGLEHQLRLMAGENNLKRVMKCCKLRMSLRLNLWSIIALKMR